MQQVLQPIVVIPHNGIQRLLSLLNVVVIVLNVVSFTGDNFYPIQGDKICDTMLLLLEISYNILLSMSV